MPSGYRIDDFGVLVALNLRGVPPAGQPIDPPITRRQSDRPTPRRDLARRGPIDEYDKVSRATGTRICPSAHSSIGSGCRAVNDQIDADATRDARDVRRGCWGGDSGVWMRERVGRAQGASALLIPASFTGPERTRHRRIVVIFWDGGRGGTAARLSDPLAQRMLTRS